MLARKGGDVTLGSCARPDPFSPEPIAADSPTRTLPNVFLSPHIAGVTEETGPRLFTLMVDEFERLLAGHERGLNS